MYAGPLAGALIRAYAGKRKYSVLEDSDPTGYKSKRAEKAKAASRITPFCLPPRSPDLNPLDFSLWAEVNKRMRRQERRWSAGKRETRAVFLARLRRTATRLPPTYIDNIIGDMQTRCQKIYVARGGYTAE